jgi:hypothetical protein
MRSHLFLLPLLLALVGAPACIRSERTAGVNNLWRRPGTQFTAGKTTEQQLLDALGPPSQLIALKQYTVYYYMLEQSNDDGMITIVYNSSKEKVIYDRAIFFFDAEGLLHHWSKSDECLPLRQGPACCPPKEAKACR